MALPTVPQPDIKGLLDPIRRRITEGVNPPAIAGADQWAYDPHYDAAQRNVQTQLANLGSNLDLSEQRATADYQKGVRDLDEGETKSLRALANKMGNQGLGFSSFNMDEQGNVKLNTLRNKETLGTNVTRGLEDMTRQTLGQVNQLGSYLSEQQALRADRETERQNTAAMMEAQTRANEQQANDTRGLLEELKSGLLKQLTPQPTPTGALTSPPPPQPSLPKLQLPMPTANRATDTQSVMAMGINPTDLQKHLQVRGFDPGAIDGQIGAKTHRALILWKQSVGLPANIDLTPEVYQKLISAGIGTMPTSQGSPGQRFMPGPARAVQIG